MAVASATYSQDTPKWVTNLSGDSSPPKNCVSYSLTVFSKNKKKPFPHEHDCPDFPPLWRVRRSCGGLLIGVNGVGWKGRGGGKDGGQFVGKKTFARRELVMGLFFWKRKWEMEAAFRHLSLSLTLNYSSSLSKKNGTFFTT